MGGLSEVRKSRYEEEHEVWEGGGARSCPSQCVGFNRNYDFKNDSRVKIKGAKEGGVKLREL